MNGSSASHPDFALDAVFAVSLVQRLPFVNPTLRLLTCFWNEATLSTQGGLSRLFSFGEQQPSPWRCGPVIRHRAAHLAPPPVILMPAGAL